MQIQPAGGVIHAVREVGVPEHGDPELAAVTAHHVQVVVPVLDVSPVQELVRLTAPGPAGWARREAS